MTPVSRKRLTREESRIQTRQDLLMAARELFAARGFEGTSTDQIAEAAGYSRGALYSNFSNKEDLLISLIEHCMQEDILQFQAIAALARQDPGQVQSMLHTGVTEGRNETSHLLKMEFWMCALRYPRVREVYAHHARQMRGALGEMLQALLEGQTPLLNVQPEELGALAVAFRNGLDTQKLIDPTAIEDDLYTRIMQLLIRKS